MISLELAEKLRSAGFYKERINNGDIIMYGDEPLSFCHECMVSDNPKNEVVRYRLDQLLAEIKKSGNSYRLGYYRHVSHDGMHHLCEIISKESSNFWGRSDEDAAGHALLWILERGGKVEA